MSSDRRLHPASILFNIAKQFGALAIPLLLLIVGMGTDEDRWQGFALIFIVPYAAIAVTRYLTFRYRYDDNELSIRHGLLFRNERHVPYDRIQNIDAVQNVLHRLLGVVEVRIQTGGGAEPEATLSVLTQADLDEMRRRVFAKSGRPQAARVGQASLSGEAPTAGAPAEPGPTGGTAEEAAASDMAAPPVAPAPAARELLRLRAGDLALYGIIENRGLFLIAAALGLLSEFAARPEVVDRVLGPDSGRSVVRSAARTIFADGPSVRMVLYAAVALILFLLVSRVFSILWALVRLHGFSIVRTGDDVRTEYGLLTRIVQTIPRRRIQTITIRQTPLHRLFGRASVRVSTAGGTLQQRDTARREWFAPIVRDDEVASLIAALVPAADIGALAWRGVHPRAFRRAFRVSLLGTAFYQAIAWALLGAAGFWLLPVFVGWAFLKSRRYVRNLGWCATGDIVAFRTGAFVRAMTLAPLVRIQAVALGESPFDRRTGMARVRVDTAGSGGGGYHVDVPYLPRETAMDLHAQLSAAAAATAFQW